MLVHGAWHGPWCWDAFAAYLSERGHDVRVVRLRGHDQRRGRIWSRVPDYVDDVVAAAAAFTDLPVLVGHSMGGLVVQKYLERHPAAAAVLMASVPPGGTIALTARLATHHPLAFAKANLLLSLRPFIATPALVRKLFFTATTPAQMVDACLGQLQDESYLAHLDMMIFALPRPRRIKAPVLVLGAEEDGIFTVAEVRRTARAYRTKAEIFPAMGHDMMLDVGWQSVADRVDRWVREASAPGVPSARASVVPIL
jgi:pimeloyl-ACP methyl ester carboxylesterase